MSVIVANANEVTDGSMYEFLSGISSKLPIVLISRPENFKFNYDLHRLDRYIIADVSELGWDYNWQRGGHLFGVNTETHTDLFLGEEWQKFETFVRDKKPELYLCRELMAKDQSEYYIPLNYPCRYEIPPIVSKEEFYQRPLDVFYTWGLSHPQRRRLQGDIWTNADKEGYMVADNLYWLAPFVANESNSHKWLSVNIPHYCRLPVDKIIGINGNARISISMPGAGTCCFRHTESPINSVMLMKEDGMAWSFPWLHYKNCLKFYDYDGIINTIQDALQDPRLYEIYCDGVENCRKYHITSYTNHFEKLINAAIK